MSISCTAADICVFVLVCCCDCFFTHYLNPAPLSSTSHHRLQDLYKATSCPIIPPTSELAPSPCSYHRCSRGRVLCCVSQRNVHHSCFVIFSLCYYSDLLFGVSLETNTRAETTVGIPENSAFKRRLSSLSAVLIFFLFLLKIEILNSKATQCVFDCMTGYVDVVL